MRETTIECRLAGPEDWNAIWPIVSAVISGGDTYTYPPDINEVDARSAWMLDGQSRAATYVAVADGTVLGTAHLKPNQPGLGDHVANAGWMVAPSAAGRGIGRALADHVIAEARRFGFEAMQFNAVVATNTRAIGLWESMGFAIVGTVPNAFRHSAKGLVPVHIMYRDLTEAEST
ncbi:GNAT family N-acetyltransferase [Ilumatobacter nonamiensis]|uniref:GNAT family N-acetyltransferase n=1 Tax=Ilumatobacter nonamiensis TaxID=467093 RepID=UPI0003472DE5|nr:GNAT family N-acetyltransferase [Ilumatobacter nonamiensis]